MVYGSTSITVILPDATSSAWYTAPGSGGSPPGKVRVLRLKRRDATSGSTVTVQGGTYGGVAQTIDGASSMTLAGRGKLSVVSDGANWQIMG